MNLNDLEDSERAAFGFATSQVLLGGAALPQTRETASAGWHGEGYDANLGAYALVQTGGILAALVGERIQVSYKSRSVIAYVLSESAIAEDLSLTRSLFQRLGELWNDEIMATVEVVA